jgi:hypothetical protein
VRKQVSNGPFLTTPALLGLAGGYPKQDSQAVFEVARQAYTANPGIQNKTGIRYPISRLQLSRLAFIEQYLHQSIALTRATMLISIMSINVR